jgi:hypothetical protein
MERAYQLTEFSDLAKDYSGYGRFYVGDQHCEHNCIAILSNPELRAFVRASRKAVTVLTPQVSQLLFSRLAELVREYLEEIPDPEIVVNDFGMLRAFAAFEGGPKPVWGNALVGQSKDPMIREFSGRETHVRLGVDLPFYQETFRKYGVGSAEIFHTFQGWKVTNLKGVDFHLHAPYVPYSQTRYCRIALAAEGKDFLEVVTACAGCHFHGAKKLSLDLAEKSQLGPIPNLYVGNRQMYRNDGPVPNGGYSRIVDNSDLSLG